MINSLGLYGFNTNSISKDTNVPKVSPEQTTPIYSSNVQTLYKATVAPLNAPKTVLDNQKDIQMYNDVLSKLVNSSEKISPQDNVSRQVKLDALLKSGILLNRNSNNSTSVLENLHKTVNSKRAGDMDPVKITGQVIDTIYDPAIITQTFGDIPNEAIIYIHPKDIEHLKSARALDAEGSGTCVAASVEYSMAHRHPAEFARWAEGLTSENMTVEKDLKLSSLSKNKMDAIWLLNGFETPKTDFDFNHTKLKIKPDDNALVRAKIQHNFWDKGERNIIDVMFQSALMNLGSQQTYDSLTDRRAGNFSIENQGLVEFEKTYIESVAEDKERTSVVYQNMDDDQILTGYNYDIQSTKEHIKTALDDGEDVIIGCIVTAKDCNDGKFPPNKVMGGHEMTITGYRNDDNGNMMLICNDTDDNKPVLLEYPADVLIPKIHHASYTTNVFDKFNQD